MPSPQDDTVERKCMCDNSGLNIAALKNSSCCRQQAFSIILKKSERQELYRMGNCCSCIGRDRYHTHVAIFDYESRTINDLELRYGDKLLLCEDNGAIQGGGFLKAKNVHTGKEGYVPSNHIAPKRALEAEP